MRVSTTAPAGLLAERSVYFHHAFAPGVVVNDGHVTPGAPAPSCSWSFAEGSTLPGFFAFLTIPNPTGQRADVMVVYSPDAGPRVHRMVSVPAHARLTVQAFGPASGGGIGSEAIGFGITVSSGVPVVAERPFYVRRAIPGLPVIDGGSSVVGVPG